MKRTTAIFVNLVILSAVCVITDAQLGLNLKNADLSTTPGVINPVEVEKKTTSTTTTAAPTTSSTPSTTTSTTTTTTTPTTTPSTTSSTTTTTTTTKAPDTTTTPAPITTTPAPKPYPEPEVGTWNSSCIMVRLAAQLNFTYETKDNKTATGLYNIPKNAVVDDAHCDMNTTQFLQLNWGPLTAQHVMLFQFDSSNGTSNLTMMMFTLPLMSDHFPNAKENQTIQLIHRGKDFSVPARMSYHCTRAQHFNLTETIAHNDVIGTVKVRDVQVEAFRAPNASGFASARDCDSSESSDAVPIAVGIALGALILIVLISYLCARRRSSSGAYMSF